jgi:hypothetical protein
MAQVVQHLPNTYEVQISTPKAPEKNDGNSNQEESLVVQTALGGEVSVKV